MRLIGTYSNAGLQATADAALAFYERRSDLHTSGLSFGDDPNNPRKVSTDISLVWVDRSDAEAFGISDLLMRAVSAGLNQYLKERELFSQVTPEGSLFVVPLFNLQRYAPGEGFKAWHADWSTADDITQPIRRVLAWILYLNDVDDGGTEFHWQEHHVELVAHPGDFSGRPQPCAPRTGQPRTGQSHCHRLDQCRHLGGLVEHLKQA